MPDDRDDVSFRRAILEWTAATAVAEALGYAVAAALFGGVAQALLAGLVEGTLLGLLQAAAWMRLLGSFRVAAWWAVTATVATLGWGGASLMTGAGPEGGDPGILVILLGALALGAGMGLLLGTAQWLVLRRRVAQAARWIPASVGGWAIGMVPAMGAAALPAGPAGLGERLLLGAAGGLLMGAAVGVVTGRLAAEWAAGGARPVGTGVPAGSGRASRVGWPPVRDHGGKPGEKAGDSEKGGTGLGSHDPAGRDAVVPPGGGRIAHRDDVRDPLASLADASGGRGGSDG